MSSLKMTISGEHIVPINFSNSYNQLVGQGVFDQVADTIIPEHFPIDHRGITGVKMVYVGFSQHIKTDEEVIIAMRARQIRPSQLVHIAAFGILFPDLQRHMHLIGVGQNWRGFNEKLFVPSLACWIGRRWLGIVSAEEGGYNTDCRFLGITDEII